MAKYIEGQHLSTLQKEKLVFWTKGNEPTQKANNLTYEIVLDNLKLLYLLSGKVIASASYFFESQITQQVTEALNSFFEDGDIAYFYDDNLENPTEHAKKKISNSPKELLVYRNKRVVLSIAKKLETFGNNLLRRPPLSISNKIVELWIDDVSSTANNSIGAILAKEIRDYDKQKREKDKLISFARNRDKDFVWDYIKPILNSSGLTNPDFHKIIRKKLSQMYALATANVLGVELDEKVNYNLVDKNSKYDTSLFSVCIAQLGILQLILQLNIEDLKQLKYSFEFAVFRDFYFKMIEDCEFMPERIRGGIASFSKIETANQKSISKKEFVNKFIEYSKLCNYPRKRFKQRLDEIKANLDNFNSGTMGIISNFVSLVHDKQEGSANKELINENIDYKLREYKNCAIKSIVLYLAFVGIAIFVFLFKIPDEKLNEVLFFNIKWKHIKWIFSIILFLLPMIRSFIRHEGVIKSFMFLLRKKERTRIKAKLENEQNEKK
jgi:hypothetical protein